MSKLHPLRKNSTMFPVLFIIVAMLTMTASVFNSSLYAWQVEVLLKKEIKKEGRAGTVAAGLSEQYKQTIRDLMLLSTAVEDYILDNDTPPRATTIKELLEQDAGMGPTFAQFYLDQIPEEKIPYKDAWGNWFIYKADGNSWWLASAGSNGIFVGFKQYGVYLFSGKEMAGKDIIVANQGLSYGPVSEMQMEKLFLYWHYQLFFIGL